MFRQTLLVHDSVKLDYALRPGPVKDFYVSTAAKPVATKPVATEPQPAEAGASEEFRAGKSTLSTADPLMRAAMHCLADASPMPLRFAALLAAARQRLGHDGGGAEGPAEEARQLAVRLLNCHLSNLVDLSISAPAFVRELSDRPLASPYARLRASEGPKVVNLRLESIVLAEPSLLVLQHLDGRHDRQALIDLITRWIESHPPATTQAAPTSPLDPPAVRAANYVDQVLQAFARSALLIG
jgi:methyltransferase-like protein